MPILTAPSCSAGPTRRFSWCTSNGWPTPAGHKGRTTGRQPTTRGARRASRSLHLAALAAPHSTCSSPRPSPSPGTFVAPAGCSPGLKRPLGPACGLPGLPATTRCLLLSASVSLPTATCLLGRCCSGYIPARVPCSPAALRAARRCWSCCVWRWAGVETHGGSRWSDLNGRRVLSF